MRDFDVISIDIETSGTDVDTHTLLSIGCVRLSDMQSFYTEVRHESFEMSPESARVHGLNLTNRDSKKLPKMSQVDVHLRDWLKKSEFYRESKSYTIIPMGMNVGSFDMQFVRKFLPKSFSLLGYRSIDLNALMFTDALMRGKRFKEVKSFAKEIGRFYAIEKVPDRHPHDALFDAWVNVGVFHHLVHDELTTVGEIHFEGGNLK